MKLDAKYRPEDAVSHDETRPHMMSTYLDVEKKRICATDGHILAVLPCEPGPNDVSGNIPPIALQRAREKKPGDEFELCAAAATAVEWVEHDGVRAAADRSDTSFPPVDLVMPDMHPNDPGTISFALDPTLLLKLATALGQANGVILTLKCGPDSPLAPLEAILVIPQDGDGPRGLLMPCRIARLPPRPKSKAATP